MSTSVRLVACVACAKLKVSCDRKNPCSRCTRRNIHCEVRHYRRGRKPSGGKEQSYNDKNATAGSSGSVTETESAEIEMPLATDPSGFQNTGILSSPLQSDLAGSTMMDDLNFAFDDANNLDSFMFFDDHDFHKYAGDFNQVHVNQPTLHLGNLNFPQHFAFSDLPIPESSISPQSTISAYDIPFQTSGTSSRHTPRSRQASSLTTVNEYPFPIMTGEITSSSCPAQLLTSTNQSTANLDAIHTSRNALHVAAISSKVPLLPEDAALSACFDLWSLFRCNPPDQYETYPKPADLYLEGLRRLVPVDDHEQESQLWGCKPEVSPESFPAVSRLQDRTRDQLLAIMQNLFRRAFELNTHTGSSTLMRNSSQPLVMLPSSTVLEHYFKSYRGNVERFYPLLGEGTLDLSSTMDESDICSCSLQLLLMIALGSSSTATSQARSLSGGLTEACRICFTDIFERETPNQATLGRIALLFTILAVWSGDHSHMSFAIARKGLFMCTIGQLRMYEEPDFILPSINDLPALEQSWKLWKDHQSRLKLVYSWVKVDLEFSIFHDSVPMIPVSEVTAPMPASASLSTACSAEEWKSRFEKEYPDGRAEVASLAQLFETLIEHDENQQPLRLPQMQLGLLLHPLQTLVYSLRQLLSSFSEHKSTRRVARAITPSNVLSRLEEAQTLLSQWYRMFDRQQQSSAEESDTPQHDEALRRADLVLYHLTYLKTITDFKEIEQRARDSNTSTVDWSGDRLVREPTEAWQHCSNALNNLRALPSHSRPPWWAAAVYRVAMIALAIAMIHTQASQPQVRSPELEMRRAPLSRHSPNLSLSASERERPNGEGNDELSLPSFTRTDGGVVTWDDGRGILDLHIELLRNDERRFSIAIRAKLLRLRNRLCL